MPSRRNPVTPSSTSSGAAPQFVVTTGVPHAMASTMTSPNGSGQRIGKIIPARPAEPLDLHLVGDVLEHLDVGAEPGRDLEVEVRLLERLVVLHDHRQLAARTARDLDRLDRSLVVIRPTDVDEEVVLLARGAVRVRVEIDAVVDGSEVTDVVAVDALRVADRDEVHVLTDEPVEQPGLLGPRTVQRVHDRWRPRSSAPSTGPTTPA